MCDAYLAFSKTLWEFTFMKNNSHGAKPWILANFKHLLPLEVVWKHLKRIHP